MPEWEDFITGGPDGTSTPSIPQITQTATEGNAVAALYGVPADDTLNVNALPLYAYNKIYNQRYRDQDVQSVVSEGTRSLRTISWEKDYFTTARPFSAKGPQVTLPVGTSAPIVGPISGALSAQDSSGDPFQLDTSGAALQLSATPGTEAGTMYADLGANSSIKDRKSTRLNSSH